MSLQRLHVKNFDYMTNGVGEEWFTLLHIETYSMMHHVFYFFCHKTWLINITFCCVHVHVVHDNGA